MIRIGSQRKSTHNNISYESDELSTPIPPLRRRSTQAPKPRTLDSIIPPSPRPKEMGTVPISVDSFTRSLGDPVTEPDSEPPLVHPLTRSLITDSDSATTTPAQICEQVPMPDLVGNAFFFDNQLTFNGRDTRLELPNSADKFEDGPFTVYVEWVPTDPQNDAQQIVGHYNWEFFQNSEEVVFRVGRMNQAGGPSYTASYKMEMDDYLNKKQSALLSYVPVGTEGYIVLYVNGLFAGRTSIKSDIIWVDYGINNLSFGKSSHGQTSFFQGYLLNVSFSNQEILVGYKSRKYSIDSQSMTLIPIYGTGTLQRLGTIVSD